ncbi:MAG: transglutaminase domain-containing protein [Bacteroidota bacterium]
MTKFVSYCFFIQGWFLAMVGSSAFAQAPPMKWGRIPANQVAMIEYEADPDAAAVILGDYGYWRTHPTQNEMMMLTRHVRIKILKAAGLPLAEQQVSYLVEGGTETLNGIKVQTINWDNGKKQVHKLAMRFAPHDTISSKEAVVRFRFPNALVGSVLEYEYTLFTKDIYRLQPWYFQHPYPTLWSQVQLNGFGPEDYLGAVSGKPKPVENNNRWALKYVPALREEVFASSPKEEQPVIHFQWLLPLLMPFQLSGTDSLSPDQMVWEGFRIGLEQDLQQREQADKLQAMQKLVDRLILDQETPEDQLIRLYEHVRDHFRWDGTRATWLGRSPADIYGSAKGNSAEINATLYLLLDMAGITARLCLVSTRDHGPILMNAPVTGQFNHLLCLAKIEDRVFFLDATDPRRSYDLPDPSALNQIAFLLQGPQSGWIQLPTDLLDKISLMVQAAFTSDLGLAAQVDTYLEGYAALDPLTYPTIPNAAQLTESEGRSQWHYSLSGDSYVERMADRLFIEPMLGQEFREYTLPDGDRFRPFDFRNRKQLTYVMNLVIPDGYEVESLPMARRMTFNQAGILFEIGCQEEGRLILFKSSMDLRNPRFLAEDKQGLQQFFTNMIESQSERIVLKKISP